jgi:hypothetical protein
MSAKSIYSFPFQDLDEVIGAALEFYEEKKLLQNDPLPLALEKDKDSRLLTSPLKFPGKLAVDVQNNRLFISDSNHNRIVRIFVLILLGFYHYGTSVRLICLS